MPARRRGVARLAVLVAAALPLLSCSAAEAPPGAHAAARVDSLVAAFQRESRAPGVSVAVVRAGRDTLVLRGYGVARLESGAAVTPGTVFRIGSMTKQFTAALVLQLADEGRLTVDDSIGTHLPDLPAAWRGIRVRHLLNHTSGLPGFASAPVRRDWMQVLRGHVPPDSLLRLVGDTPPDFAPGAEHAYSNLGYIVLGLLVEKVSGEPFTRAVQERIAGPLGLRSTGACSGASVASRGAAGYEERDTLVVDAPHNEMVAPHAAGVLCSTAGDLAAWNRALATGRVVRPASWAAMTTPGGAAAAEGYGFGLRVGSVDGRRMHSHGGVIEGFGAMNAYLPEDSLSVTVLTNLSTRDSEPMSRLLEDVVRAALGADGSGSVAAEGGR